MTEEAPLPRGRTFRVPLGLNEAGKLTSPVDASKGTAYQCPACASPLVLRKGTKKQHHFAHKATPNCSGESALHRIAKLLVAELIIAGTLPEFEIPCAGCRRSFCVPFPQDRVLLPSVEHRLPNGRVLDVGLLDGYEVALAVEVFHTSVVTEEKAQELSMPWIELDAKELIATPNRWRARQHGLKVSRCKVCRRAEAICHEEMARVLKKFKITFNRHAYKANPAICWRCNQVIPVFEWTDGMWNKDANPPSPRPATLRWVFTRTTGNYYWANHCAACGKVQGDFFLHQLIAEFHIQCIERARHELEVLDLEA